MFLQVATLYSIHSEAAADLFVSSIRLGGEWQQIARRVAMDLIGTDLLRHQSSPTPLFLCIDFWRSREAYERMRESPAYDLLFSLRNRMAQSATELGVFTAARSALELR
jgi:hypothetical protein